MTEYIVVFLKEPGFSLIIYNTKTHVALLVSVQFCSEAPWGINPYYLLIITINIFRLRANWQQLLRHLIHLNLMKTEIQKYTKQKKKITAPKLITIRAILMRNKLMHSYAWKTQWPSCLQHACSSEHFIWGIFNFLRGKKVSVSWGWERLRLLCNNVLFLVVRVHRRDPLNKICMVSPWKRNLPIEPSLSNA